MDFSDPQIIDGQHLDQHRLVKLLQRVYGTSLEGRNNFKVETEPLQDIPFNGCKASFTHRGSNPRLPIISETIGQFQESKRQWAGQFPLM
ncbi:hypothetical protein B0O99DRAFT_285338 [Bisporella sp. PMI_857]|nr:hypothetical protein B0O99DRAFT_285338 [Bisporella sp. PMI_857]